VKRAPIRTTADLYWELDLQPSTTKLRRRSADVAAVFLNGFSCESIAHAIGAHVCRVEDAIRWEMKRRDRKRGRRG
jgi:hypothetical protein